MLVFREQHLEALMFGVGPDASFGHEEIDDFSTAIAGFIQKRELVSFFVGIFQVGRGSDADQGSVFVCEFKNGLSLM